MRAPLHKNAGTAFPPSRRKDGRTAGRSGRLLTIDVAVLLADVVLPSGVLIAPAPAARGVLLEKLASGVTRAGR